VRGALNLHALSGYMEAAVGISIMVIGANGVREAREWPTEGEHDLKLALSSPTKPVSVLSTLGTGILHGCSGSGHLLGVMPALAMPSWIVASTYAAIPPMQTPSQHGSLDCPCRCTVDVTHAPTAPLSPPPARSPSSYLFAFGLGTMLAMSLFTGAVGELSAQMSDRLNDPSTPGKLAFASSLFALTMGTIWTGRALCTLSLPAALSRGLRSGLA
jgi:sulfite exporter TauE/SafE